MAALYVETSAALRWLLGDPNADLVITALNRADNIVTSVLTLVEAERALIRAETQGVVDAATRQRLNGILASDSSSWAFLELTASIRSRASQSFPVEPVRTLDAVHLASALEALQLFPDMSVLSFDRRIVDNLAPLGIPATGT